MALTATATHRVADDIVRQLHLREPAIPHGGFERENLCYRSATKQGSFKQIVSYLEQHPPMKGSSTARVGGELRL